MNDDRRYPFLGLAALAGGIMFAAFAGHVKKEDEKAWRDWRNSLGPEAPEHLPYAHRAWLAAIKYARKSRHDLQAEVLELKSEVSRLQGLLDATESFVEVSIGMRKAVALLQDKSVPALVRASTMQHWLGRWAKLFGMDAPDVSDDIMRHLETEG